MLYYMKKKLKSEKRRKNIKLYDELFTFIIGYVFIAWSIAQRREIHIIYDIWIFMAYVVISKTDWFSLCDSKGGE
jgi:hypothetical protein